MYRAITLFETLITLTIVMIALVFISPIIFRLHSHWILDNEIDHLKSFLYRVQKTARYRQQNYLLSMAQDQDRWCIIAVAKKSEKQTACHCGYISSCSFAQDYFIYRSQKSIRLNSKKQYPKTLANIDGKSGEISATCLNLSIENQQAVLQIQRNGVINVLPQNARTQCKETT